MESRFDELIRTEPDRAVGERDLLRALYLIGLTLEEIKASLAALGEGAQGEYDGV